MAHLIPLEANSSHAGGFLVRFPSGLTKSVAWARNSPVVDSLKAAKETSAALLQSLLDEQHTDDANRTNWVSLTAAVQSLIVKWNEKRRAALYAEPPRILTPDDETEADSPSVRH